MIGQTHSSVISISFAYVSRGDKGAEVNGVINERDDASGANNMNENVIIGTSQSSAFVNVIDPTNSRVIFKEVYSSLLGLPIFSSLLLFDYPYYQVLSSYGVLETPSWLRSETILSSLVFHSFLNHAVCPNHLTSVGLIA